MMDDRRAEGKEKMDGAYGLATLYTVGYLGMLFMLMLYPIPEANKELLLTLAGIMSAAQLGIIKYFYDGSRGADAVQQANIARSVRSEAVVQEIAKTVPVATAAAVAASTAATAAAATPGAAIPIVPVDAAPAADTIPPQQKGDTSP